MGDIKWLEPDLEAKAGDIAFAADDMGVDEDDLTDALEDGSLVALTDAMWKKITNSDSLTVDSLSGLLKSHKARRSLKGKGRKARDLFHEFVDGKVNAPIVVRRKAGSLYIVNGNTRLGLSRMLDVKPSVWLADVSDIEDS